MIINVTDLPLLIAAFAGGLATILLAIGKVVITLTRLQRTVTTHAQDVSNTLETIHTATNSRLKDLEGLLRATQAELAKALAIIAAREKLP